VAFWWENLKERDNLEDLHIDGRIILKLILNECNVRMWTEFSWLRIGQSGGLFWTLWWTFGIRKIRSWSGI